MEPEGQRALLIRAEAAYREATADPRRGRRAAERVAGDARASGNREAEVVSLRAAGWAAMSLYDHDGAERCLDEAVRVARGAGFGDRLSEALITRAAVHLEVGREARARQDLAAARRVAGGGARAEVAFAEGLMEDQLGDYQAAARAYREALDLVDGHRDHLKVKTLNNLGLSALRLGRYAEAQQRLEAAVEIAGRFSPSATAHVTQSLASVAVECGRPNQALRHYQRADELLTALGLPRAELHLEKAAAFLSLRLLDEAAEAADLALEGFTRHRGGALMLAEALVLKARIAVAQDHLEEAVTAAARGEGLLRQQRRAGWRAEAMLLGLQARCGLASPQPAMREQARRLEQRMIRLGNVPGAVEAGLLHGQVCRALGRPVRAARAFARAAEAAARGPVLLRLQGRLAAALHAELKGETRRLARVCCGGLDELAAYRASLTSAELRARAAAHGRALAELGLRAAVRSGRTESIWGWMERASATIFLSAGAAAPGSDAQQALLAERRSLTQDLRALEPDDAAARVAVLRRITAVERRIQSTVWAQDGEDAEWTAPTITSLRALRHHLDGRVLLQYGTLDDRLIGVAVTGRRIRFAELGPAGMVRDLRYQLAFALRRLGQPRSRASTAAALSGARSDLERLADTLLAPFAGALEPGRETVVAAPSSLISVPWGALAPLADAPVRVVPSALSWWRTRQRRPRSDRVVVVAGPDLAGAEGEVEAVARRYQRAERLVGAAASTQAVCAAADGARLVHVACHGRLRADSPTFSALDLVDGPLTVHDLECLEEPAHHWVLAACDLAQPGRPTGGELEGVLAALLSRGAAGVVAASVSVPDLPTAQLMVGLHEALAAGSPLSHAMLAARRGLDTTDPVGFVTSVAFSCYGGG